MWLFHPVFGEQALSCRRKFVKTGINELEVYNTELDAKRMKVTPDGLKGWFTALMHASEAFILCMFAVLLCDMRHALLGSPGEQLILIHCVVTLLLLISSVIMLCKRAKEASIGLLVAVLGVYTAFVLLPVLGQ